MSFGTKTSVTPDAKNPQIVSLDSTIPANGDLIRESSSGVRSVVNKFSWNNDSIVALGANSYGVINVCSLPVKTKVNKAFIVITSTASDVNTLTVSLGRVGENYTDYVVASNALVPMNTIYGDEVWELGENLSDLLGDYQNISSETSIFLNFVAGSGELLSNVKNCSGYVLLDTTTYP